MMKMSEAGPQSIERLDVTPVDTGGPCGTELSARLWRRCLLLFLTGLGVTVLAGFANRVLTPMEQRLLGVPFRWAYASESHAAVFLAGLGLLLVVRKSHRHVGVIAWSTVALTLILAMYGRLSVSPASDPYFAVSLLLFPTAAFLPWRARYQIALAATAVLAFTGIEILLFNTRPAVRLVWAEHGGIAGLQNALIWGSSGLGILGAASVAVSGTLYVLCRSELRVRRLGKYVIKRELKSGGMGQIYLAEHALLLRPTAVKVVHPSLGALSSTLARFEREVKLSATLSHPNTITIYDVGRTRDGGLYYAMEYLEGLDLEELVERFGPLPAARVVSILQQVCGSLAEAHERNIIHRDIKPPNIFLTWRGGLYDFVKVLDFGLAKRLAPEDATQNTKTGVMFGTPRYLAPETVYGSGKVDNRADIYCLGGVAYWMLTGRPPFVSRSSVELVIDHVKTRPVPPSRVAEVAVPGALDALVMKCLEKNPDDRFRSIGELESTLEALDLGERWTREQAREWWRLHGMAEQGVHVNEEPLASNAEAAEASWADPNRRTGKVSKGEGWVGRVLPREVVI